jgi:ssDNA-binding Zn-finger/Zn-ribbon topoisomerase 1
MPSRIIPKYQNCQKIQLEKQRFNEFCAANQCIKCQEKKTARSVKA